MSESVQPPGANKGIPGAAEHVHQFYALIDAGDFSALGDLLTDDIIYHRPGFEPLVGKIRLQRFYRDERTIREGKHDLDLIIDSGEDVAVHGRFRGFLIDGREISHRFAEFFERAPDGRFARRDTFFFAPLV